MEYTIERVMFPYIILAFFMGCGIYKHPKSYPRRCLSIGYIVLVWSVYVWNLYKRSIREMLKLNSLLQFLNFFTIGINLFLWIISVYIAFYKYEEQSVCIKKLDLVNDTLEKIGISKEFIRMRKEIKWSLIVWFMLTCILNILDKVIGLYLNLFANLQDIIAIWIVQYPEHVNTVLDFMTVSILRYIGIRLDKINNHIVQLSKIENYDLRCMPLNSLIVNRHYIRRTEYRKRILWIAMHLHLELCHVARNINALYGMRMTIQMASYFVVFTGYVYIQYHRMVCLGHETGVIKWYFIIFSTIWTIYFLSKLIIVNYICESVSAKAERTKIVIHKLTNLIRFADAYDEIYQFGLQLSLHPLKFTGLGLFYFGYKFVRSFAVWVFSIVLLLVQVDTFVVNRSKLNARECIRNK